MLETVRGSFSRHCNNLSGKLSPTLRGKCIFLTLLFVRQCPHASRLWKKGVLNEKKNNLL